MIVEPTNIVSRIEWCRLQQLVPSVMPEEREGWRAEEAGLVDALFGRDRMAFMRKEHPSQVTRYQCGFEDGHALLHFDQVTSRWHDASGAVGRDPLTAPAQVARRPSQAPSPMPVESRR